MTRVVWFDIPVSDMSRAIEFYSALTGEQLTRLPVGPDRETALFAADGGGSPGCLFLAPEDEPSHFGSRVYFDANPSIEVWIERARQAGGKVLVDRTPAGGDNGYFAYLEDSEGNRIGLNARE